MPIADVRMCRENEEEECTRFFYTFTFSKKIYFRTVSLLSYRSVKLTFKVDLHSIMK